MVSDDYKTLLKDGEADISVEEAVELLDLALENNRTDSVHISLNKVSRSGYRAAEKVDPASVEGLANDLVDRRDKGIGGCRNVARIFNYVRDEVEYNNVGSGFNFEPEKTLKRGGNCVDQSVLLCSLLESQGFTTILFSIGSSSSGHHTCAGVCFMTKDLTKVWNDLAKFYTDGLGGTKFSFTSHVPVDENHKFTVADPEFSNYVGDISSLVDDGYCQRRSEGWNFYNLKRVEKPSDYF